MRKIYTLPSVPLDIEEKERHLRLDFGAIKRIEDALAKPFAEIGAQPSTQDMVTMIWACLCHEDPDLTVEHVAGLIGPANMEYVVQQFTACIAAGQPEGGPGKNRGSRPTG